MHSHFTRRDSKYSPTNLWQPSVHNEGYLQTCHKGWAQLLRKYLIHPQVYIWKLDLSLTDCQLSSLGGCLQNDCYE